MREIRKRTTRLEVHERGGPSGHWGDGSRTRKTFESERDKVKQRKTLKLTTNPMGGTASLKLLALKKRESSLKQNTILPREVPLPTERAQIDQ